MTEKDTRFLNNPTYTVITIVVLIGISIILFFSSYRIKEETNSYIPTYDLVLKMKAPVKAGLVAVYLNADWSSPYLQAIKPPDESIYRFRSIPEIVTLIRLDPGSGAGHRLQIDSLHIETSQSYAPKPGHVVKRFDTAGWANWVLVDVERRAGEPGVLYTKSHNVTLVRHGTVDLTALLPAGTPRAAPFRLRLTYWIALAAGGLFLFAAIVLLVLLRPRSRDAFWYITLTLTGMAGFAITVASGFPAHSNFDEFSSLNEALANRLTDIHPPLQTVSWLALIRVFEAAGFSKLLQISSMLLVQSAAFWVAAVCLALAFKVRGLGFVFLIALALLPPILAYTAHHGKDTHIGIAFFICSVALYWAMRRRSYGLLLFALLPLFYGLAVRSNGPAGALPLVVFWCVALMHIRGADWRGWRRKLIYGGAALALFFVLNTANKAVYDATVENKCCLGHAGFLTPLHDMIGISYYIDKNIVPKFMWAYPEYPYEHIKKTYYPPSNIDMTWVRTTEPKDRTPVLEAWLEAVTTYPGIYLRHRWDVVRYFFGFTLEPNSYAVFLGFFTTANPRQVVLVDPMRDLMRGLDDLPPRFKAVKNKFIDYLVAAKDSILFRPWFYCGLLAAVVLFLGGGRQRLLTKVSAYLWTSAALYFLPYILLTSSASFRYAWWSVFAVVVVAFMRLDETLTTKGSADRWPEQAPLAAIARWRNRLFVGGTKAIGLLPMRSYPGVILCTGFVAAYLAIGYAILWTLD